ncbi:MAG TPA: GNAT family N-acetyltransferase [Candidatus Limnocylindrales bacterium]|nr:GNAT family N-acetyltransferase [Candidatus Limnocylindrales bacterium]
MAGEATLKVVLREVEESDIVAFYEHQLDPQAAAMGAYEPRGLEELTARWHRMVVNPTITARAITVDNQTVGHVVSWIEDDGHRELGYLVASAFWGRGIATAAVRDMLKIVTDRPIEAWIAPTNAASIRVVERNGFSFVREDGEYQIFRLV